MRLNGRIGSANDWENFISQRWSECREEWFSLDFQASEGDILTTRDTVDKFGRNYITGLVLGLTEVKLDLILGSENAKTD